MRILCFGDSITNGYVYSAEKITKSPYADKLTELLAENGTAEESGVCGETTREIINRLELELLHDKSASEKPFDVIILQGGVNDIGSDESAERVFENLRTLWTMALEHTNNTHVLVMTLPSVSYTSERRNQNRDQVNKMLRKASLTFDRRLCLIEAQQAVSVPAPPRCTSDMWSDNLHFSAKGYNKLATHIFNVL